MADTRSSIPQEPPPGHRVDTRYQLNTDGSLALNADPNLIEQLYNSQIETPTQENARRLYGMGLNVFPIPYRSKQPGYKWSRLQTTRLHPTHEVYGLHSLTAGRVNLAVMTGRTSGNLLVIDAETEQSLEYQCHQLRARGIPIFAHQSGGFKRGGGIYLRIVEGEVKNLNKSVLGGEIEIWGHSHIIVTVCSVHPVSGQVYQWYARECTAPPVVSLKDIDWLVDPDGVLIDLELRNHHTKKHLAIRPATVRYSPLSRKTQDYLAGRRGQHEGERDNSLFAAACDMAGNGYSPDQTERELAPLAIAAGLSSKRVSEVVSSAYSKHREPSRKNTRPTAFWGRAVAFMRVYEWRGVSGHTDRAVFAALIERAKIGSNANGTFRAAHREISELARCGLATVGRSLDRLKHARPAPLICYAGRDKTSTGNLWRFSDYVLSTGHKALVPDHSGYLENGTLVEETNGLSSSVPFSKSSETDAVERGALNRTGLLVYRTLCAAEKALTPSEIAARANLSKNQVYNALSTGKVVDGRKYGGWLRASGLVEKQEGGWIAYPATDAELDERIAAPAGKLGARQRRRKQFESDRQLYLGRYIYNVIQRPQRAQKNTATPTPTHSKKSQKTASTGEKGEE